MRKALLLALAALGGLAGLTRTLAAPAPEPVPWLRDHTLAIRTLDPADPDLSDLEPLAAVIGGARVVQLGEATHAEGSTFLAKARLIRFLHERMGFDVLAIESGFYDVRDVAAALRGNGSLADAAGLGLYQAWAKSVEVQPTLAYLRATQATPRPIDLVGFDCRVATVGARERRFPDFVFEVFDRFDPGLISAQERADLTAMSIGLVPADYYKKPGERHWNRALVQRLIAVLDGRRAEMLGRWSESQLDYARQALVSLLAMDRALPADPAASPPDAFNRDKAMAENLLWWLRGPLAGRKVIVWAHNYHIGLDGVGRIPDTAQNAGPMGRHLKKALGADLFTLAFVTHHGRHHYAGSPPSPDEPEEIPPAAAGSLEDWLHQLGKPFLVLDLHRLPEDSFLRQPQTAHPYFYEPQQVDWPRIYDAFFFIDEMKPSTEIP